MFPIPVKRWSQITSHSACPTKIYVSVTYSAWLGWIYALHPIHSRSSSTCKGQLPSGAWNVLRHQLRMPQFWVTTGFLITLTPRSKQFSNLPHVHLSRLLHCTDVSFDDRCIFIVNKCNYVVLNLFFHLMTCYFIWLHSSYFMFVYFHLICIVMSCSLIHYHFDIWHYRTHLLNLFCKSYMICDCLLVASKKRLRFMIWPSAYCMLSVFEMVSF